MTEHAKEVASGKRFEFGKNWARFLAVLNDERIAEAEESLRDMLGSGCLEGRSFLDIGSGSGLFSLAARRLGARVHSFDFDPASVACTRELKRRYFANDDAWTIAEGSALDAAYIESLGSFDVVYSWGVLHHTGAMWDALDNARLPVRAGGHLFIALYRDQGLRSRVWLRIKQTYCSGLPGRAAVTGVCVPGFFLAGLLHDVRGLRNPFTRYREYKKERGMSMYHDWLDWLGGLPYEVARPDDVIAFYKERGFEPARVALAGSWGCNQFVFRCIPSP